MWQWIKQMFKSKEITLPRHLVWLDSHGENWRSDGNWWCPYCKRWVVNGLFSEGGEWERKRFSNGGGDVRYYDTGACKICGAYIQVDMIRKRQLEAFDF